MSISDIIEQFILDSIGDEEILSISRNGLAEYFNCVPSQINYVLSTRFTIDKGFIIESKRGGGGCINIVRINKDKNKYISTLITDDFNDISEQRAKHILQKLVSDNIITQREGDLIYSSISDKTLIISHNIKNQVRANMFKSILRCILKDLT